MTHLVARDSTADRPVEVRGVLRSELPPGSPAIALLPSDQVVLAMAPVETVTMQNQLRGRIVRLIPQEDSVTCVVDAGFELAAQITHQAQADFNIRPGANVWCLFKAAAVKIHTDVFAGPAVEELASHLRMKSAKQPARR